MSALTELPTADTRQWVADCNALVAEARGWCESRGWAVHVTDKRITESQLGEYSVPTLQLRGPEGGVVFVEPVARLVAAADGLVDVYAWPSLRRFLLVRQGARWTIRTDSGVPLPWKWDESSFVEMIHSLTSGH